MITTSLGIISIKDGRCSDINSLTGRSKKIFILLDYRISLKSLYNNESIQQVAKIMVYIHTTLHIIGFKCIALSIHTMHKSNYILTLLRIYTGFLDILHALILIEYFTRQSSQFWFQMHFVMSAFYAYIKLHFDNFKNFYKLP